MALHITLVVREGKQRLQPTVVWLNSWRKPDKWTILSERFVRASL